MAVQIILKNSNVQDREVTAGQLDVGEIALNYHESGPFLQCKDSTDRVWRIGGVIIGPNAPSAPARGAFWYQEATDTLRFYTGTSWVSISTTAVVTSVTAGAGLADSGTADSPVLDIGAGAGITVNPDDIQIDRGLVDTWYAGLNSPAFTGTPSAPTAAPGTNTTQLASTAFVSAAVAAGGASTTAPTNPTTGQIWVDTSQDPPMVMIWDGTSWVGGGTGGTVPNASETVRGIVELATATETIAGTDNTRAVHPAGLKAALDAQLTPGATIPPAAPTVRAT